MIGARWSWLLSVSNSIDASLLLKAAIRIGVSTDFAVHVDAALYHDVAERADGTETKGNYGCGDD